MDPLPGAVVSHYRVLEQIGAGGMGVVYLAEDERLHRKVALKFITPSASQDQTARRRLLLEAQAASSLDHPNIATVYEVGDFHEQLFIAMAYYSGETLKSRIEHGPLSVAECASIAGHIAEGLEAAHAAGVTHRDLKPANIFLTSSGQVKILDFGLAKVETDSRDTTSGLTSVGTTLGTVSYMAPEQARGVPVDHRADVWALGVLIFEMFTGRLPFRGETASAILLALATEAAPSLRSLRPDAPPEFATLVDHALVKDPERRTLTAGDAVEVIAKYRDRTAAAVPSARSRTLRRPIVAIPLAVSLVVVIGFAAVFGNKMAKRRWARYTAVPEIARLADRQDLVDAVDLAGQAEALLPGDAELAALWPRIARTVTIESVPPGADISYASYGTDARWRRIGSTPVKDVRIPIGLLRFKAEKPGFDPAEDVTSGIPAFSLAASGSSPEGMVRASPVRGNFSIYVFGLETPRVTFGGFWIDRYEVTNRQVQSVRGCRRLQTPRLVDTTVHQGRQGADL